MAARFGVDPFRAHAPTEIAVVLARRSDCLAAAVEFTDASGRARRRQPRRAERPREAPGRSAAGGDGRRHAVMAIARPPVVVDVGKTAPAGLVSGYIGAGVLFKR